MNPLIPLLIPLAAGLLALSARRLPALGGLLAVLAGTASLLLTLRIPAGDQRLTLFGDVALSWPPLIRLLIVALWLALILFGLLETARPGRSFVIPATLLATGVGAIGLSIQPLPVAVLLTQLAALLMIFPALQGPGRQPWGSLGFLTLSIVVGATSLIAVSLADFYTQNPDEGTARMAATLLAVAIGSLLALSPLHLWLTPLAESAPNQVLAWVGLVGQTIAVGLLIRFLVQFDWLLTVTPLIQTLILGGLLSMTLGGLLALVSTSPRHWLAYTMLYSMGVACVGLGLFTEAGMIGAVLMLAARALGLFLATAGIRATMRLPLDWDDVRGLSEHHRAAAVALVAGGAVFAAIPPLVGFPAAWLTFRAAFALAPALAYLMLPGMALMGLSLIRLLTIIVGPAAPDDDDELIRRAPPTPAGLVVLILALIILTLGLGWAPQAALSPIITVLASLRFLQ